MDDALDRMMGMASNNAAADTEKGTNPPEFIAAKTWQGPRDGYYFGTSDSGTGYYWDHYSRPQPKTTKKRKRVTVNESMNKTRILLSGEELLERAEKSVDPHSKILELSPRGLANATTALGKILRKNSLQRAKHPDNPEQYMDSELALHEQIAAFSAVAAASPSLYGETLRGDLLAHFWTLLSHENNDVALTVIRVLGEWLDPDQANEENDNREGIIGVAKALVEDGLELVVANLGRINLGEDEEEDQRGFEDIVSMVETLVEMELQGTRLADQPVAAWLTEMTGFIPFLFGQIEGNQNRFRAAEALSLVFQQAEVHDVLSDLTKIPPYTSILVEDNNTKDGKKPKDTDGLEILLQGIATYRKKQPPSEQECDYLENLVLCLASALTYSSSNVSRFLEAQGMELAIRCLRERVHSGGVCLGLLDIREKKACENLVSIGALKHLFPVFMGRSIPRPFSTTKKARKAWLAKLEGYTIQIFYNLTRFLSDDSPKDAKKRLLVKFLENDCEKCDRLVELLLEYDQKARKAEYKFYRSDVEDGLDSNEAELAALDAKLRGGGDLFHRVGAICAFGCVGSRKIHEHIMEQLRLQNSGIGVVKAALEEFVTVLDDGEQKKQLERHLSQI